MVQLGKKNKDFSQSERPLTNKEIEEKIRKEIEKAIFKIENDIMKKIQRKEMFIQENLIIPETAILLSLIELLKQKEVITEEELDEMLKKINPEEYEKLKQQYELFSNETKKKEVNNEK